MAGSVHGWEALGLAWAGGRMAFAEPGVPRHYAPSRCVRIERASITLRLWPQERRFEGEAEIEVTALASHEGRFALDLDEVEVLSVRDEAGAELDWSHRDGEVVIRGAVPRAVPA